MPWNQPGNNNDKDPWGNRKRQDGPPDLDDLLKKVSGIFGGKGSSGGGSSSGGLSSMVLAIIFIVLAGLYFMASFYKVDTKERSVVTRFGQYLRVDAPGPHFAFWPMDRYRIVDVTSLNETQVSGEMLTQDDNVVTVNIKIQYRILDPQFYVFNVAEPDETLVHAAESALRQVIGHSIMEDVLTQQKEQIRKKVTDELNSIMTVYKTGIDVVRVNLGNPELPSRVRPAYYDAVKAEEDEQRFINEAQAYRNKEIPLAEGKASRIIQEATAYQAQITEKAKGQIARFEQLLPQYKAAPKVTRERLYLDMMEDVLSKSSKVMIDVEGGNNMMYLPLNEILKKSQPNATSSK